MPPSDAPGKASGSTATAPTLTSAAPASNNALVSTAKPTPIIATTPSATWSAAAQRAQARVQALQDLRQTEARSPNLARRIFDRNFRGAGVLGRVGDKPAFRVGQLDTELLDDELLDLLKEQLWGGIKYLRPSIKENYEPELVLLLRAALFKLSIWDNNATYGAALQGLHYVDARRKGPIDHPPTKTQKTLYGLVTVVGRYVYSRLDSHLINNPHSHPKLVNLVDRLTTIHSVATLFSFLAFLTTGRYRTLLDRFLRMRLVPPDRQVAREVSFEFLNRQLVWHAFTEFLLFILPILKIGKWRRWWARLQRKLATRSEDDDDQKGELAFLPAKTCAICYKEGNVGSQVQGGIPSSSTDSTNPYEAECGCVYCYVCIATKIQVEEGEGWECLRCGQLVKRCWPWRGEDGEDIMRSEKKALQGVRGDGESDDEGSTGDRLRVMSPMPISSTTYSSTAEMESDEEEEEEEEGEEVGGENEEGEEVGGENEETDDTSSEATERGGWFTTTHDEATSATSDDDDAYATANASEVENFSEGEESGSEGQGRRIF